MTRLINMYTGVFALMIAFGVFISFKTTIVQHGGSKDLCSDSGGEMETAIVLKEFLDKVIADTYKELTEDTAEKYRYMKSKDDGISSDELNFQDRDPVAKLESDEPISQALADSRQKKKG